MIFLQRIRIANKKFFLGGGGGGGRWGRWGVVYLFAMFDDICFRKF